MDKVNVILFTGGFVISVITLIIMLVKSFSNNKIGILPPLILIIGIVSLGSGVYLTLTGKDISTVITNDTSKFVTKSTNNNKNNNSKVNKSTSSHKSKQKKQAKFSIKGSLVPKKSIDMFGNETIIDADGSKQVGNLLFTAGGIRYYQDSDGMQVDVPDKKSYKDGKHFINYGYKISKVDGTIYVGKSPIATTDENDIYKNKDIGSAELEQYPPSKKYEMKDIEFLEKYLPEGKPKNTVKNDFLSGKYTAEDKGMLETKTVMSIEILDNKLLNLECSYISGIDSMYGYKLEQLGKNAYKMYLYPALVKADSIGGGTSITEEPLKRTFLIYRKSANSFDKNFLKRARIINTKGGQLYIYNKCGKFEVLGEYVAGKIIRDVIHEVLPNSWKSNYEKEIIKVIEREVPLVEELNCFAENINLKNGMLNTNMHQLECHNPKFLSSIQIPITYDPQAKCGRFLEFINEITVGDKQVANIIQEILGYCLTAETRAEKAFYFYGGGSNGKSVLAKVIKELVGVENVTGITLDKIGQQFGLQSILDKTVNIAAENELFSSKINTENLKALISGYAITVSIKYKAPVECTPKCKLIFLVNTLPNTSDVTHGYFRKIMIIPFKRKFSDEEKDVNLFEKLKEELSGILNWALEGLKRLKENNYIFSEAGVVNEICKSYEEEQNPVLRFIDDAIVEDLEERLSKKEIFEAFNRWSVMEAIDDKCCKSNQVFWKLFILQLIKERLRL